jgi:hypothetical protein
MSKKKEAKRGSVLNELFTKLIADKNHISPPEVTYKFIMKKRNEDIYPDARYVLGSKYGGHNNLSLLSFTQNELNELGDEIDQIMDQA